MSNSAFPPPICAGFSPAYAHADPARFFGWRPRAVATVLLFSSDAFCLHCLRHANLDGAAIAAEMNIVSAAADDGRIHALTRDRIRSWICQPD